MKQSVPSTVLPYLRLHNALQCISFWKKMIFHEIFQVVACPNLKDSSLNERFFYSYVQGMQHLVSSIFFLYLRLPNALYGIFYLEKDDYCHKYFKLAHAPTLNIPHYMLRDVSIHTQREASIIYSFLCYMRLPYSL